MIPPAASTATQAGRAQDVLHAALSAARDQTLDAGERAEMLMEVAVNLQLRPKTVEDLQAALTLYDEALSLSPAGEPLLAARINARRGTVLQALPESGSTLLERARRAYEEALPIITEFGSAEELAELEMNRGLALQELAARGRARMADAIAAYQRALGTFDGRRFPAEFAIVQNNLATAFLSVSFADDSAKVREALAVHCFEEALKFVTLIEHPIEYAMLQNNLGNALQHAATSHIVENRLRAISAYDEALKVRTRANAALEYANTIANKATCLSSLPDDPTRPEAGQSGNLQRAKIYFEEARAIFIAHGETAKVRVIVEALEDIDARLTESRGA